MAATGIMNNMVEYDLTMHCIYKMYCNLFQKFGWIILSKSKNDKENPKFYLKALKQFKKNIIRKSNTFSNKDNLHDCKIMLHNIEALIKHAEKDFKNSNKKISLSLNNNLKNIVEYDVTMCGIHKWYDGMIEKLGWMIVAEKNKDEQTIEEYLNTLLKLYKSILLKHRETNDKDRKIDYELMKENVEIIINHVKHDFKL